MAVLTSISAHTWHYQTCWHWLDHLSHSGWSWWPWYGHNTIRLYPSSPQKAILNYGFELILIIWWRCFSRKCEGNNTKYPLVNCSITMEDHHQRNGHWDVGSPQVRRPESLGIFDLMGMTNDPLVLTWHSENHQNIAGLQVLTNMTWDKPPFFAKLIPFLSANRLPRHFLWLCLSLRLGSWVPFSKVFDALAI